MFHPEKKYTEEQNIREENVPMNPTALDENNLEKISGGGPGAQTACGVRDGKIATTPAPIKLTRPLDSTASRRPQD